MMYLVGPMMGVHMDIAAMLGSMLGGSWAVGMMLHFVNGTLIFPAIYAPRPDIVGPDLRAVAAQIIETESRRR